MNEDGSLLTSLEFFEKFGEYFIEGLSPRVEHEVKTDGPEITNSDRTRIAEAVADGALLGRTIWGGEGAERTGCFLWVGAVSALLGDEDKKVSEFSAEEMDTVEHSLKLSIEEGGDKPPVDWSGVEPVGPDDIEAKLKEIGVAQEFECATLPIRIGERTMSFVFLMSTETVAADATDEGGGAEGEYVGTSGEAQDDPVAAAAAAAMAAASSLAAEEAKAAVAAPAGATGAAAPPAAAPGGLDPEQLANLEHLLDVRLPITIRLGSTRMPLEELLALTPGSILELDRREDEPLELLANGQVVGRGEVVVVDERFGLRITEIGSPEERVGASF